MYNNQTYREGRIARVDITPNPINKLFSPKDMEEEPLQREVLVHGMMKYFCRDCGRVFRMWLEQGLEDKSQDKAYPDKHKPVPFTIGCLCGGMAEHTAWHEDIDLGGYRPLGSNMSYFENSEDSDCGISHLRTDGSSQSSIGYDDIHIRTQQLLKMQKDEDDRTEQSRKVSFMELDKYSTTQLKAELRRRKQMH